MKNIKEISVTRHTNDTNYRMSYTLNWSDDHYRYHVWMNAGYNNDGIIHRNTLYKPIKHTPLKLSAKINENLYTFVWQEAYRKELWAQADREWQAKQIKQAEDREQALWLQTLQENKQELYECLKEIVHPTNTDKAIWKRAHAVLKACEKQ